MQDWRRGSDGNTTGRTALPIRSVQDRWRRSRYLKIYQKQFTRPAFYNGTANNIQGGLWWPFALRKREHLTLVSLDMSSPWHVGRPVDMQHGSGARPTTTRGVGLSYFPIRDKGKKVAGCSQVCCCTHLRPRNRPIQHRSDFRTQWLWQFATDGFLNMAPERTSTKWDHEYHIARRQKLFQNPPTDRSAYPALQAAVNPHIESFNALFSKDGKPGLIDQALAEIGIKTFFDGDERAAPADKNKLTIRYKSISLQKSQVPPINKYAKNREIYPAECRERHVSYRGKLTATLEYRINNGEPHEFVRELGQMPIMIKASYKTLPAFPTRR